MDGFLGVRVMGGGVSPHQSEGPERLVSGRHLVASPGTAPPSEPWGLSWNPLPKGTSTIFLNTATSPRFR